MILLKDALSGRPSGNKPGDGWRGGHELGRYDLLGLPINGQSVDPGQKFIRQVFSEPYMYLGLV